MCTYREQVGNDITYHLKISCRLDIEKPIQYLNICPQLMWTLANNGPTLIGVKFSKKLIQKMSTFILSSLNFS